MKKFIITTSFFVCLFFLSSTGANASMSEQTLIENGFSIELQKILIDRDGNIEESIIFDGINSAWLDPVSQKEIWNSFIESTTEEIVDGRLMNGMERVGDIFEVVLVKVFYKDTPDGSFIHNASVANFDEKTWDEFVKNRYHLDNVAFEYEYNPYSEVDFLGTHIKLIKTVRNIAGIQETIVSRVSEKDWLDPSKRQEAFMLLATSSNYTVKNGNPIFTIDAIGKPYTVTLSIGSYELGVESNFSSVTFSHDEWEQFQIDGFVFDSIAFEYEL